ncbi:uncharacterized protein C8Q71DRAFT_880885 [Rhodofomes roseus]|uniref:Uncharacterized protein n=1 Tax=Rhodofomes roseus TaxID=34475 RepID=A0ABQ8K490_9APHY|nr:uncharacterized protein C8Q71DRAFT_880885 [Rhodofomes roseus]KAH9831702.1 hypothetical protein C8Q71DRAFT_880885 [Rhodofomes roseus]
MPRQARATSFGTGTLTSPSRSSRSPDTHKELCHVLTSPNGRTAGVPSPHPVSSDCPAPARLIASYSRRDTYRQHSHPRIVHQAVDIQRDESTQLRQSGRTKYTRYYHDVVWGHKRYAPGERFIIPSPPHDRPTLHIHPLTIPLTWDIQDLAPPDTRDISVTRQRHITSLATYVPRISLTNAIPPSRAGPIQRNIRPVPACAAILD